jgi:hypothetical protein
VDAFLTSGRETMLAEVVRLSGGAEGQGSLAPALLTAARQRLTDLATCCDTKGISFAGDALHYAYIDSKFALRGGLAYQVLHQLREQHGAVGTLFGLSPPRPDGVRVASIGGGPGTDVAGVCAAACVATKRGSSPCTHYCTLFDFERSWRRLLPALQALARPAVTLEFAPCDVRVGLGCRDAEHAACVDSDADASLGGWQHHNPNQRLAEEAPHVDIFIFSFVANEMAAACKASGWAVYKDLAEAARPGALFLFLDVRRASCPSLDAICDAMMASAADLVPVPLRRSVAAEVRVLVKS